MGNSIDKCCYSNGDKKESSVEEQLKTFQFILSPEVGKQHYSVFDDDQ